MTQAAPIVGNETFLRNLRALWQVDPRLAMEVDAVDDEERFPLEAARSGSWTLSLAAGDGQRVYLHSRYDPVGEAERFATSISLEKKYVFVVCGLGLGYHICALWRRLGKEAVVVCAEPSMRMIATALACTDLSELIGSGRLIFLTSDDKSRLHERLERFNALMMLGAQFVNHAPSIRLAPDDHRAITQQLTEFVTFTRMTLATLMGNARITCKNIAMNLAAYVSTPPIDLLRDRFAGNPAVVIAAGPSLRKNIDKLAGLKGRAVLIAVQTTLRPLLERGIIPDFATSLDFHEMSRKFFEGLDGLEGVHLVAEPKATWHVIDDYPGPVSLLDNAWARLVLGDALGARDGLRAGATVAHLAFYLAAYLGCDPIVFVGQDLAYTGHVFYIPGVEIHHAWRSEFNRFQTLEQKEWERIVRNRPILRRVRGQEGGELYTDELLFTYLEQFEKDVARTPRRVINATEGGAMIRGTSAMRLDEVAARFCREPIDEDRFAYREEANWFDGTRLPEAAGEVDERVAELDDVVTVCDELLVLLDELEGLTSDPLRFNRRLVRIDELRSRIHHQSRGYRIVNAATQAAEFRRYAADRQLGAVESTGVERARQQIARDREFIRAVREGAIDVRGVLKDAASRVRERMNHPCA
ncbi:MAG: motility associated factor glycosyltransferase family protein [Phycisphaerae bacterium]|nr:motility associated factor glycosyltransferase family protein [Phycisphaerae bacterium]